MERIVIHGGMRLKGSVRIGGSKNAALPILFAGILTGDVCTFSNLPRVSDVLLTLEILRFLGARIRFLPSGEVVVDYSDVTPREVPYGMTACMRGSVYLLGALLGRFGRGSLAGAGGCNFGNRPIDQHLYGFTRLGATVVEDEEKGVILTSSGLSGCEIHTTMPSVGATANLLMAATGAVGETVLSNAALEPHVQALVDFLRQCGAAVTSSREGELRIKGGSRLHGCHFRMIPDMIEAGTYLCMGAACGGSVRVLDVVPAHLSALLGVLEDMGAAVRREQYAVTVTAQQPLRGASVTTGPYPAFPTDLQPQISALCCLARGESHVRETVFESRFGYTGELLKMGADITLGESEAHIVGGTLHPAMMTSPDLRGGAALLLAALATRGRSEIMGAATIARGYEHLSQKLTALGARVRAF